MSEWMRPELQQLVRRKIMRHPGAMEAAQYVDAEGRRQPAYAATHIRVHAFFRASSHVSLDPLEEALREIPELIELERIEYVGQPSTLIPRNGGSLRRQVIGLVRRHKDAA